MAPRHSVALAVLSLTVMAAAVDYPAKPLDLTTPTQQRISIRNPGSISIGWNTFEKIEQPCVKYGTSPSNLTSQVCSTSSTTYPTSRTYFNSVSLSDLKQATTYYYKIVSTNSSVETILSPRVAGDKTPFSMNAVIDLGVYGKDGFTIERDPSKLSLIPQTDPSLNHTTIGRLVSTLDKYELVIHPGDFAYADDWYLRPQNLLDGKDAYEAILEQFFQQLAPVAARRPYMASPGNHEAACEEIPHTTGLCPAGQKNFTDFRTRFGSLMPTAFPSVSSDTTAKVNANHAAALANPPFWFSFDYGMVHVTMFNTETDFDNAPDQPGGSAGLDGGPFGTQNQQLQFLEADLASVDRLRTPWLVVAGHRPWYTDGSGCAPCQTAFESLLYKYAVDIGIFGHVHNSQRIAPIYRNVTDPAGLTNPKAPMYIVAGGAGNIEGLNKVDQSKKPAYVEFANGDDFSYATLSFEDAQHLKIDFIKSETGDVLDSSTLFKSHLDQFPVQS